MDAEIQATLEMLRKTFTETGTSLDNQRYKLAIMCDLIEELFVMLARIERAPQAKELAEQFKKAWQRKIEDHCNLSFTGYKDDD